VLASTCGAVSEVCAGAAATTDPLNVYELTQQLARLAQNEVLRKQLRAAGLARAREFDWRRTAAETFGVYERAATRIRAPVLTPLANVAH
jgi:glycosyltransferase involved in cell wall biosynthesis